MKHILLTIFILLGFGVAFAAQDSETLIILDQSASMLEFYNGKPKIEYAKQAVRNILQSMPDSANIGFRTVGVHPAVMFQLITQNPNALCEATILHNEIVPNNKQNISNSLAGIMPSGASPLQYTLQLAIDNDFYIGTKNKHIILVTDGYENCDGDPCRYIRREMLQRDDLKIDIVAIGVPHEEKGLLGCLSEATNGNFLDVETNDDIAPAISKITGRMPNYNTNYTNYRNVETINNNANFRNIETSHPAYSAKPQIQYKSYLLEFFE